MATVNISGEQGGSLAIVHADGTVDVWNIPQNANISVTGQRGFGDAIQTSYSVSLSVAESDINLTLGADGAK